METITTTFQIIGAPFDGGAGVRGTARGPAALRNAGLVARLQKLPIQVVDGGDIFAEPSAPHGQAVHPDIKNFGEALQFMPRLFDAVSDALSQSRIPIILGGDHAVSLASIAAVAAHRKNPVGVLWIDAHADLNTPKASPSKNLHGMPLACLLGLGPAELSFTPIPIDPNHIAIVGLRDADPEEKRLINERGIHVETMTDIDRDGMGAAVARALQRVTDGTSGFVLSFDLDAPDPHLAPGVGSPVRGGITFRESHLIMELACASKKLCAVEMVELNPNLDPDGSTADLAVSLLESVVGKTIL